MSDFAKFSALVHARYNKLAEHELHTVGCDTTGDTLWAAYLAAFPAGTNEIYRTRTEHDCSCCRNFIRNLGNVVSLRHGVKDTVWDIEGAPYPYDIIAKALHEFVITLPVNSIFRSKEHQYGVEHNFEHTPDGTAKKWNHFHGKVKALHFTQTPAMAIGEYNSRVGVFARGLEELSLDALSSVIELINSDTLYRGQEHERSVKNFHQMKTHFLGLSPEERIFFIHTNAGNSNATFRNTVIGTLVQDLSEGKSLEHAVKSFESKVAPTNYKRTTALVTPSMIKSAMETINKLGIEPALKRRFAKISDVTINNVLWADNSAKVAMGGGLDELLMSSVKVSKPKAEASVNVPIDEFMRDVAPKAKAISIFVENRHQSNFMSVTAPVDSGSAKLFKWMNGFAWSYTGNLTDSIKERVKSAGGAVEGYLCCRLAWDYTDDLDFHMIEPDGNEISFRNRRQLSRCGGMLDLDANGTDGIKTHPAENIVYASKGKMVEGEYTLFVHNYSRRSNGVGFQVEIEVDNKVINFEYDKALRGDGKVVVAGINYSKVDGITIEHKLPSTTTSREVWGLNTESFTRVKTIMHSPNHWDGLQVGNKHHFFILEGCLNDTPARGIYNEYLHSDLEQHRKVFELVGEKTKCPVTPDQLSGVGFSSTVRNNAIVKVELQDDKERIFNVTF